MVGACFGVYTFQWVTIMQWLPSFLNEEVGLTLEHAIYFTAAVVFMNGPGCYVGVRFAARGVTSMTCDFHEVCTSSELWHYVCT